MTATLLPNLKLQAFFSLGEDGWANAVDQNFLKLSTLVQGGVIGIVSSVPSSPTDDLVYILAPDATSHPSEIAASLNGQWNYFTPSVGWVMYNQETSSYLVFDGQIWQSLPLSKLIALSNLNSATGLVEQTGPNSFSKRALGVASSGSIPTLLDADTRYAQTSGDVTFHGAITATNLSGTNTGDQTYSLAGDVISPTSTGGVMATSIGANKVLDGMLAQIPTHTFKGRFSPGTGNVEILTAVQATAILNKFSVLTQGVAPASGGDPTTFLRADGVWAQVAGSTGVTAMSGLTDVWVTGDNAPAGSQALLYDSGNRRWRPGNVVTNLTINTVNGISGTVTNPNTIPSISLTLGAITPVSVTAFGNIVGANLSGTNTGDQTITLGGDLTGSGNSNIAATIAANAVGFSKIVGAPSIGLIGAVGAGNYKHVTLGTGLSLSQSGVLSASGGTSSGGSAGPTGPTGPAGPAGPAGPTGPTGPAGSSGVITLTGDVVGSGTGTFGTTISASAVTFPKLISAPSTGIVGADQGGDYKHIVLGAGLALSGGVLSATGGTATGGGTVTSVSISPANGISGTVSNPTFTPSITLSLGNITPASVAATGTVTGSNLSGANSGDQTIALTGDVTGSGTGSFAATIANNAVTFAKQIAAPSAGVVGASAAGNYQHLALGANLSISAGTLNASSGGNITASTRSVLAGLSTVGTAFLYEAGREGTFFWIGGDLSAFVTADPQQAIYVAPTVAPSGSSGAWVRKLSDPGVNIGWFGAVGDCTAVGTGTDDTAAFVAAINFLSTIGGGILRLGYKRYRVTQQLKITQGIQIIGVGWTQNPGYVAGVAYPIGPLIWRGSVLVFDANVAGIIVYANTDTDDTNTVVGSMQSGINSPEFKYPGGGGSRLADFVMVGGGTGLTKHGIETRATITVKNIRVFRFAGSGIVVNASADITQAGTSYGNADLTILQNNFVSECQGHGYWLRGRDANVIQILDCNAQLNGGWGFCDQGFLGNSYINCHAATNNQATGATRSQLVTAFPKLVDPFTGSYYCESAVADNTYNGCYTESGQGKRSQLTAPCMVIGGNSASEDSLQPYGDEYTNNGGQSNRKATSALNNFKGEMSFTGSISGSTLTVSAIGDTSTQVLTPGTQITATGLTPMTTITALGTGTGGTGTYTISPSQTLSSRTMATMKVTAGIGRDPGKQQNVALWFGSVDDTATMDSFRLTYQFLTGGTWSLNYANSYAAQMMEFGDAAAPTISAGYANAYSVGFPNGLTMGSHRSAPRLLPAASAMPTTGLYRAGDRVPNIAPVISSGSVLLEWVRLTTGSAHVLGTDWTPVYGTNTTTGGSVSTLDGTAVTITQAGTGAVVRDAQSKSRDQFSVLDFIPTTNHAAIIARTSTTDVSNYIQAAIDAAAAVGGGTIYFPPGLYYVTSTLNMKAKVSLFGAGKKTSTIYCAHNGNGLKSTFAINGSNLAEIHFQHIGIVTPNESTNTGIGYWDVCGSNITLTHCLVRGFKHLIALDQSELVDIDLCVLEWSNADTSLGPSAVWLVNGNDLTPSALGDFTNRISINRCQFNGGATAIAIRDDGGYTHSFRDNNYNGFLHQFWLCATETAIISGGEFESCASDVIVCSSASPTGISHGQPSFTLENAVVVPSGTNTCINNISSGYIKLSDNMFSGGSTVGVLRGGNVFSVTLSGNYHTGNYPIFPDEASCIAAGGHVIWLDGLNGINRASHGFLQTGSVGGIGYAAGAGGAVVQATSKATGITLNKPTGTITMNAASLAGTTSVSFTLSNSQIAATDVVMVSIKSGATAGAYVASVDGVSSGSCLISLYNRSAGALSESVVLNFAVLKGAAS